MNRKTFLKKALVGLGATSLFYPTLGVTALKGEPIVSLLFGVRNNIGRLSSDPILPNICGNVHLHSIKTEINLHKGISVDSTFFYRNLPLFKLVPEYKRTIQKINDPDNKNTYSIACLAINETSNVVLDQIKKSFKPLYFKLSSPTDQSIWLYRHYQFIISTALSNANNTDFWHEFNQINQQYPYINS